MDSQTINISTFIDHHCEGFLVSQTGRSTHPIDGIVTIGRSTNNDLTIHDPHISGQHCRIEKRPGGFFIKDLKSRNGTHVNGIRIFEAQIVDGTQIQIGNSDFIFRKNKTNDEHESSSNTLLVSKNKNWQSQLNQISQMAQTQLPIFLQGESGTGKEILSQLIHSLSDRSKKPFISVNCSALTETLVESELFGHLKGSYTGATSDRKGAFEAARGGTLFLDEIGDLPLSLQPKLLRALENKEIKPVGGDKVVSTDVRIITATHKNLEDLVNQRQFRADLYFRINVVKLTIPALRHRMEDFESLLYHFCREYMTRFSVGAINQLKNHAWPGNIRELRNTVARAQALFPGIYIEPEHLNKIVDSVQSLKTQLKDGGIGALPKHRYIMRRVEKDIIVKHLLANHGNQRKTAIDLGIPKSTLHDRIRAYGIEVHSLLNTEVFKENSVDAPLV